MIGRTGKRLGGKKEGKARSLNACRDSLLKSSKARKGDGARVRRVGHRRGEKRKELGGKRGGETKEYWQGGGWLVRV